MIANQSLPPPSAGGENFSIKNNRPADPEEANQSTSQAKQPIDFMTSQLTFRKFKKESRMYKFFFYGFFFLLVSVKKSKPDRATSHFSWEPTMTNYRPKITSSLVVSIVTWQGFHAN